MCLADGPASQKRGNGETYGEEGVELELENHGGRGGNADIVGRGFFLGVVERETRK